MSMFASHIFPLRQKGNGQKTGRFYSQRHTQGFFPFGDYCGSQFSRTVEPLAASSASWSEISIFLNKANLKVLCHGRERSPLQLWLSHLREIQGVGRSRPLSYQVITGEYSRARLQLPWWPCKEQSLLQNIDLLFIR